MDFDFNNLLDNKDVIAEYAMTYGVKIIVALLIFIVGKYLARAVTNLVKKAMVKTKVDETLVSFAGNLIYGILLAVVVIAALNQVGIETTSLVAVLATAGLAIGLALKDSLSNFAAGVMMIIFRPFAVGDYIETGDGTGTVECVGIFTTTLRTPDNRITIVPNNSIMTSSITNYSAKSERRIDLVIGCGYSDDLKLVKQTLVDILNAEERVLKDPSFTVAVAELADSSVNFVVRPWVKSEHYWDVKFDLTERVKVVFDEKGISIPFPQRDVHIHNA